MINHDSSPTTWRELYRSDDLSEARAIATTIASMAFEVALHGVSVHPLRDDDEADDASAWEWPSEQARGPYVIRVPEAQWKMLIDAVPEIIAEQAAFDEYLGTRDGRLGRGQRRLLVVMVVLVSGLAATGAIQL